MFLAQECLCLMINFKMQVGIRESRDRGKKARMATIEVGSPARVPALPQIRLTVSMLTATAIVVADMVGVGVFTSLGFQVKDIPSGFSILALWTVGGLVALCGV